MFSCSVCSATTATAGSLVYNFDPRDESFLEALKRSAEQHVIAPCPVISLTACDQSFETTIFDSPLVVATARMDSDTLCD